MAITQSEWADWLRSPVTQAVARSLKEEQQRAVEQLIATSIGKKTVEQCGMEYLCARNFIAGIGEFLSIFNQESPDLVGEVEHAH